MRNRYLFGVLIVLCGGAFLSTSGILIRVMDHADGWQIIFFRSLTFFCTVLGLVYYQYGRKTLAAYRAIGKQGAAAAVLLGLGSACYIFALLNTTVANVVFIIGSAPLVTALLGWIFLKERISFSGLMAMLLAFFGIGLMFLDGLITGGLLGNILAVFMVITFGFYLLILRNNRTVDMVPATGLSGMVTFCIAAVMISSFEISTRDLIICIGLGSFQFGLGFIFLTIGSRYIPAAEVALFALSESILNPIWVWVGVNEVPGSYTLWGSAVVLVSVTLYCLMAIYRERQVQ